MSQFLLFLIATARPVVLGSLTKLNFSQGYS